MNKKRNLILAGIAALLLVAFFTNPDQSAHLTAIQKIVKLRKPDADEATAWNNALMPVVHYDNYFVFSATGLGDHIFTWGYFGQVQTTEAIEILFRPVKPNSSPSN